MIVPAAGSDVKPITHSPGLVLHSTTEKILRAVKDLQESKQATTPMPLSPEVSSPLMEIIPPPSSHQLQVTTEQEESATSVAPDGNFTFASEPQLSTTTQYTHTPCRLYPSWPLSTQTRIYAHLMPLVYSDGKWDRWRKEPCTRPPGLGRRSWIPSDIRRSPCINLSDFHRSQPASSHKPGVVRGWIVKVSQMIDSKYLDLHTYSYWISQFPHSSTRGPTHIFEWTMH